MPESSSASSARRAGLKGLPHAHRVHVLSLEGKPGATITLPALFSRPIRPDLIARAVRVAQANRRQPYGPSRKAGMRHSVMWSGKGHGVARTPRLMESNRGAQAPNTVGGRGAHPPKPGRILTRKINDKERRRALESALAATRDARWALERGHEVPDHLHFPVIFEDALEEVDSTARAREVLSVTGLWSDVERATDGIHVRAGRGKLRGRVRRHPRSLLVVVSAPDRARGFRNLPGVEVVPIHSLGTEHLAPGGIPGRLTLFTPTTLKLISERWGGTAGVPAPPAPGGSR